MQTNTIMKQAQQPENMSTRAATCPVQDHNAVVSSLQDHELCICQSQDHSTSVLSLQEHIMINNIEDFEQMFSDSVDKIGSMPVKYSITLDQNIPSVQHRRHRASIQAKEEIQAQLKEMTAQDIITPKSQYVFQIKMDTTVEKCPTAPCIHDDLCTYL